MGNCQTNEGQQNTNTEMNTQPADQNSIPAQLKNAEVDLDLDTSMNKKSKFSRGMNDAPNRSRSGSLTKKPEDEGQQKGGNDQFLKIDLSKINEQEFSEGQLKAQELKEVKVKSFERINSNIRKKASMKNNYNYHKESRYEFDGEWYVGNCEGYFPGA